MAAPLRLLLGPTNTGKTHRAIEQMLEHATGCIGLPLRLLAREVYDRVSARVGEAAVALVTGEEKRVPPRPRYWVCTVEAMPERLDVDFVAIDEIQLAGHSERGHVFTDRLLHARGRVETWFLGAETIRPIAEELLPTAVDERRPRLSTLTDAGSLAMGALPPRTAVVAFSATRVYELAERLRARRGGAAVVLGALSPRARNAQVALYQAGEVDYLVATDAIGMGLNMDVDCVAFADTQKFDGRARRALDDAELAQIAGRAGRYTRDGRFATLAPLPALPRGTSRAIERHQFAPQRRVLWRNHDLDFASVEALRASLRRRPPSPRFAMVDDADDARALARLADDAELHALARGQERVELLWRVCQIPDYRQLALDDHFQLLSAIFRQLCSPRAQIEADWMDRQLRRVDDPAGDLETLMARIASVRTWTYVSHRADWVANAHEWQDRARAIEDRLSDALHERLVQRFVDGSARRRSNRTPARERAVKGRSLADQLRDKLDDVVTAPAGITPDAWVGEIVDAGFERFDVDDRGRISLDGRSPLARLGAGIDLLHPEIVLLETSIGAGARLQLQRRLVAWTRDLVATTLAPLRGPHDDPPRSAEARGLLYQLERGLGTALVAEVPGSLAALPPDDRRRLRALGVHVGRLVAHAPALLAPATARIRAVLVTAWLGPAAPWRAPAAGAASCEASPDVPSAAYLAVGYPVIAGRAIRADLAEVLATRVARGAGLVELARHARCSLDEASDLRRALLRQLRPDRAA